MITLDVKANVDVDLKVGLPAYHHHHHHHHHLVWNQRMQKTFEDSGPFEDDVTSPGFQRKVLSVGKVTVAFSTGSACTVRTELSEQFFSN